MFGIETIAYHHVIFTVSLTIVFIYFLGVRFLVFFFFFVLWFCGLIFLKTKIKKTFYSILCSDKVVPNRLG